MNNHHLTEEAQADRDDFDRDMGIEAVPVYFAAMQLLHASGNPLNQEEDDCWTPDVIEKPVTKSRNKREGWYAGKSRAKLMRLWGESKKPRRFRVPEKRLSLRLWHRDSP